MLILPFQVDVPMARWPIANVLLVLFTIIVHMNIVATGPTDEALMPYVLGSETPISYVSHLFIHAGYLHLFGNMLFLWTFGNAVCAKIGNVAYLVYYILLGMLAGLAHFYIDGGLAVGASGAVNGVVGMYLVFYPRNNVSCLLWVAIFVRIFHVSSIWIILLFLAFDLYGAATGRVGVAYWAHLGGFGAGFLIASAALWSGLIEMTQAEESIYDVLG